MSSKFFSYFKEKMTRGLRSHNIPDELLSDAKPIVAAETVEDFDAMYELLREYSRDVELRCDLNYSVKHAW